MPLSVKLFIGTKRGLFVARANITRDVWSLSAPLLAGRQVYHAAVDARTGSVWACTAHRVWGAHVHRSNDGGRTWDTLASAPHHTDERGLSAVWQIAAGRGDAPHELWAGIEPAGLFASQDDGAAWSPVTSLNAHATAAAWQPAGGALALHSIHVGPGSRILCAVSAGGAYRSDDHGGTWRPINRGVRAAFLPSSETVAGHCVHRLLVHSRNPTRVYQQNHCGVYRSDDGGENWQEITDGLPSDFGYAATTDPRDPDALFVVPEESSHMRTAIDGRLRVFATRDAGETWQSVSDGLPQQDAWVSVLRNGLANDGLDPLGIYLGTSGGHVFASRDGGAGWTTIAGFLPRILSVSAVVAEEARGV
jgi:hypothetical protein